MKGHAAINRIYRLIWSKVRNAWVAVSETGRSGGGGSSSAKRIACAIAALGLLDGAAQAAPPTATQLPTGGQVAAGNAVIGQAGARMEVNQSSQRAVINWNTFNVGAQAQVNFHQPNASAVMLNRVLDTQASQIAGRISANGQVFLVNPNGVYFSKGSSVEVGGLVATTHAISDADFMAGNARFERAGSTAGVINEGELKAALGGYIALLAPAVRNAGIIVAQAGTVALASGEAITLRFGGDSSLAGITVSPSLIKALVENKTAVLAPGGLIILSAQAADRVQGGVVKNSGTLEATGLALHGGRIVLDASDRIENSGRIDASAGAGTGAGPAGRIELTAPDIINSGTIVAAGSTVNASTMFNGGSVHIAATGFTQTASGVLDVSAALQGGTLRIEAQADINVGGTINAAATPSNASAQGGDVVLAAGGKLALQDAVVDASGGQGGRVRLQAGAPASELTSVPPLPDSPQPLPLPFPGNLALLGRTQINVRGRRGAGGSATVLGEHIALNDDTLIDASGTSAGGSVLVGGDWQGSGTLAQAATVDMQAGVKIDASATQNGAGGKVVLWSDIHNAGSVTTARGEILARGGDAGGDGGQVETSGHKLVVDGIHVSTAASGGKTGVWLLDPYDITIADSGASGTPYSDAFTSGATSTILASSVIAGLASNNVTITTGTGGSDAGNINVNSALSWSGTTLTLSAHKNININAPLSVTGTTGGLALKSNQGGAGGDYNFGLGASGFGGGISFSAPATQTFTTQDGTNSANLKTYTLVGAMADMRTTADTSTNYALANNIDASNFSADNTSTGAAYANVFGGQFNGTFTGLGHTIAALRLSGNDRTGMFRITGNGAMVRDLQLSAPNITGGYITAALVGQAYGNTSLLNILLSGGSVAAPGAQHVGGIAGYSDGGSLTNAWVVGTSVLGGTQVGGALGRTNMTIGNVHASGTVTANSEYVGGLIGIAYGAISDSDAAGAVGGGTNYVGGLAGYANTTITRSRATGSVSGSSFVGGLIGHAENSTVIDSSATGNVTAGGERVGGLLGHSNSGDISGSYATGNVSGTYYVGGLIGNMENNRTVKLGSYATGTVAGAVYVGGLVGRSGGQINLSNAYYTGASVTASGANVGGLIGYSEGTANITDAYVSGATISGTGNYAGGLVGYAGSLNIARSYATGTSVSGAGFVGGLAGNLYSGSIQNAYFSGTVTATSDVGGLTGYMRPGAWLSNSFYNVDSSLINGGKRVTAGALYDGQYSAWTASNPATLANRTLNIADYFPAGQTNGYYQIASVTDTAGQQSDFSNMLAFVQSTSSGQANSFRFKLANNLDMSTASTPYMPYFSAAELNGGGFAVNNFSLNSASSNIGFLGLVYKSTIAALNVNSVVVAGQTGTDYAVNGHDYVGTAIGSLYQGTVSDSTATLAGSVNGRDYTGGFAGFVDGNIANTHAVLAPTSSAAVTGFSYTGGLVGNLANAAASALSANLAVTGAGSYVGGLLGMATGSNYNNLLASGQVTQTAGQQAGGLIGSFSATTLTNATASGAVSGSSDYVGGLIGVASGNSLSLSHASGNVSGGGQRIGGLIGQSAIAIADSDATGAVSGSYYVGGLVGVSYRGISNAYAAGVVSASESYVGGLVGYQENYIVSGAHASGGTVSGKGYVGGLIGNSDSNAVIQGSYSSAAVSGSLDFIGGLVGKLGGAIVSGGGVDSYATGSVSGRYDVGGLVGRADSSASITNATSTGAVSADANFGGLLGYLSPGARISNSHYDIDAVSISGLTPASPGTRTAIAGLVTIGGLYGAQYAAWYHAGALDGLTPGDTATLQSYFGSADANGYYSLSSTANLRDYLGYADQATLKFKLGADIDMASAAGLYIPYVAGGFDPNGKTISNLALRQFTSNLGFIGHLRGVATTDTLAGLTIVNAAVLGKTNVGAAVGSMYRRGLSTPSTTGSVNGSNIDYAADPSDDNNGRSNVGGVVGYALGETGSSIVLTGGGAGVLASTATVSGGENAGGVIGRMANGTLSDTSSSGAVSGATNTGGLVGRVTNGAITNVATTGTVTGTGDRTGGVLGWMEGGSSVLDTAAHTAGLVQGVSQVGGLAGRTDGTVGSATGAFTPSAPTYTTYATSNVEGSGNDVGGLIGYAAGGAVVNASSSGTVTGHSSIVNGVTSHAYAGYYTGGLIGESGATVNYARYTGVLVMGSHRTGGLIGSSYSTIDHSYASAGASASSVMSNSSWAGGLAGYSGNTISNAYATASVTNTADRAGGLVGYSDGSIASSWASGNVYGNDVVGGLVGDIRGTLLNSAASGNVLATGSYVGGLAGLVYNAVSASHASGSVEGYGERVGGLVGQLQGALSASSASGNVVGHSNFVGGLVGLNYDNISTSTSTGNVVGYASQTGGLVGGNHGGSITSSSATIATVNATTGYGVSGSEAVGGLVGWSQANISSSTASASVRATGNYAGGFVGYMSNATISTSGASGSVTGQFEVGGFAGQQANGAINGSYANVSVESTSNATNGMAGGFVGQLVYGSITGSRAAGPVTAYGRAGGFAGYLNYSGSISESYATGAVTQNSATVLAASESGTGGFVGYLDSNYTGTIADVYAMGAVRGTAQVGGLVGYADQGTVRNAFSTGHVSSSTGAGSVGGVFGAVNTGEIAPGVPRVSRSELYFDTTTSNQASDSFGGTGLSTVALQGSLPGSNFANGNWATGTGLYPYLTLFYPNAPQAISGVALLGNGTDGAVRAQVGLYSGGVLLNGGTASTGANGYYYGLVGAGALLPDATLTIGAGTKLAATLTLDGGSAVVGMVYSDAQTLTGSNLALASSGSMGALRQGITRLHTGAASTSVMNAEVQSTLDASSWAAFSSALPTMSSLELTATAANINLDTALNYSGHTITMIASGAVTEGAGGSIAADKLDLQGAGGSFVLDAVTNNVATLAADTGSVTYVDADALNVGAVSSIGITSTGPVSVSTRTGDLTISQGVATTDTSSSAIVLNAGVNATAGAATGGNIIISGSPVIGTGAGGRTTLYTGSVAASSGLSALVGAGSGHFRYNSDEAASNYDTGNAALGAGSYAIYREQPMLSVTPAAASSVYGEPLSAMSGSAVSAYVNGDAAANAVTSGTATFTTTATGSSHVGAYDIAYAGGFSNRLGYGYADAVGSGGEYSVTARTLTATIANTGVSKTYDGTTASAIAPSYSITGYAAGDSAASLSNSGAVYDSAHVVGASKVTVSGLAISGLSGNGLISDYVLDASTKEVAATISAASLSATATIGGTLSKIYDGTTAATGASVSGSVSGAVAGDVLTLDTSGLSLSYNSAHVASASGIGASGTASFAIGTSTAGSVASDYSFTGPVISAAPASITAATLTATLSNTGVSKTYDGTTASAIAPSYSITGYAAGDSAATLSNSGAVYDSAHVVGASKVTVSGLAISGLSGTGLSSDYVLDASTKDVAATISAASLNATASIGGTLSKTYDGTTAATGASVSGSVSGAVAGDVLTLDTSGLSLAYNTSHVVSATSIGASGTSSFAIGASTAGSVASDYSFTGPVISAAPAGITAATLTATLTNTGVSKTYDGTTASAIAPSYSITGYAAGDSAATLSNSGAVYDNAHVVGASKVTVSGLAISGIAGTGLTTDYVLDASTKEVAATISAASLSATASIGGTLTKTYDGTTAASGASVSGSVSGAVAGDALTLDTSGLSLSYNSAHVASASSIGASGTASFAIGTSTAGSVASDYSFTGPVISAAPAGITVATLTAALTNVGVSKVYDGTTASAIAPSYSITGYAAGDSAATLSNSGAVYDNAHVVGASKVTVSGLAISGLSGTGLTSDYVLDASTKDVAATITAASLSATATIGGTLTKTYDGTTAASGASVSGSVSGAVAGDVLTLDTSGLSLAYNTSHVVSASSIGASGTSSFIIGTSAAGSVASDYSFTAPVIAAAPAGITAATLTAALTNVGVSKVYDGTTASALVPLYSITGYAAGDSAATLSNSGAVYDNAHVVGASKVTVSGLAISGIAGTGSTTDYVLDASSKDVAATITAASLNATASIGGTLTKTYDGTTAATGASVSGSVSGAVAGDVLTLDTSGLSLAYNSAHVTSASSIGASGTASFAIGASTAGSVASDYSFTGPVISAAPASITAATLTATLTNTGFSKTYDGTTASALAPSYSITGYAAGDSAATLSNSGAVYDNAHVVGASKVTVSGLAISGIAGTGSTTDYVLDASSKDVAATITAASLNATASIGGTLTKTYDGTTAATGASVSGSVSGAVAGDVLTLDTSGLSLSYNSAHVASASSIGASGTASFAIGTSTAGSVTSDYSFTAPVIAAAPASITAATLTATLTNTGVSKTYDGTTASAIAPSYSITGYAAGDSAATLSNSGAVYDNAHVVGASKVTVSGLAISGLSGTGLTTDYVLDASTKEVAATISAASLNATASIGGTLSKTYDGTTAATGASVSGSVSGAVAGDALTLDTNGLSLSYNSAHVASATSIGASGTASFAIGTSTAGSVASDYSFTGPVISAAPAGITAATLTATLTNTGVSKTYDGTTASAIAPSYSITGYAAGDSAATLSNSGAVYDSAHVVGASTVTVSGLAISGIAGTGLTTDYVLDASTKEVAATISAASLNATASIGGTLTKTYDGTTAATGASVSGSVSGAVAGDALTLDTSGLSLAYNSAHVASASSIGASGTASFAIGTSTAGSVASDYSFTAPVIAAAPAGITAATLTATLTNTGVSKTYDGTTASALAPSYSITGYAAGDSAATLSNSGAVYDNAHVVGASKVTVSGLAISGIAGTGLTTDYVLDASTKDVAATISAASLNAMASIGGTLTKTYDGTTAASGASVSGSVSGAVAGDALTLDTSGLSLAYNSAHVTSASSIGASGSVALALSSSGSGAKDGSNSANRMISAASDYALAAQPAIVNVAGTITARPLRATAAAADKVYDGGLKAAPTLTINAADLVSGESVTASASGSFNTKDVNTANLVTVASVTLINGNGGVASDYSLAAGQTAVAHITPKAVNVSGSRPYDGTANVSAGALTVGSLAGSETLALSGSGSVASKNVGTGKALSLGTLALADGTGLASNYRFSGSTQTIDVTPANLTLSTSDISKTYDGSRSAIGTPVVIGGRLFAADTLSGGSFAFTDASVGSNKTVTVSGVAIDDGNGGANYAVTLASNTSSSIVQGASPLPATVPVIPPPPAFAAIGTPALGAAASPAVASSTAAPEAAVASSAGASDATVAAGSTAAASSASAADANAGSSSSDAASSASAASSPAAAAAAAAAAESAPAAKTADAAGSSAAPKAASTAARKEGAKAESKASGKAANTAKDGEIADTKATGKAAGKSEDARKADAKAASKADAKAKADKKAADAARTARQAQAHSAVLAQAQLMAAARAAARLAGNTNAGAMSAAMLASLNARPAKGDLPLGSAGSNKLLIVPPLCDGACSPAEADAAVAVLAQAQAAGSGGGAPADIMTESYHQLPWRSNSATGHAGRSRAVSEYSENLETVNFINMINLFMIP